jgi:photosystem II stability/assembly factor-like uncharacterized protein
MSSFPHLPLRRKSRTRRGSEPASSRARARRNRPGLEALEGRVVLSTSIPINANTWTALGPAPIVNGQVPGRLPTAGRIAGIAASPTDANTIYIAAAGGGVWKTTDGGAHWKPLTDDQATLSMGAITLAPSDPNTIYAGTGEANGFFDQFNADVAPSVFAGQGVLKSTDAGATWTLEGNSVFNRRSISKIVVDATDANIVYVAVGQPGINGLTGNTGIWKSSDGGQTWTNTTTSISTTDAFTDIVADPSNSQTLYAGVGQLTIDPNTFASQGSPNNGVYKSTDGGQTWTRAGNFPGGTTDARITLAISKAAPSTIYASIMDPLTFGLKEVDKSTDGGVTWTKLSNAPDYAPGQGVYDTALAVDPNDANIVYAAGSAGVGSVIESTDGGTSWFAIDNDAGNNGPHADHHALAFDASGLLLDGNDGGIWRLDIPGQAPRWSDLNGNLQITQFIGIALDPSTPDVAYGGSQDNGTEKFTDGLGWSLVQFGDGGNVRVDPSNPSTVYHTFFGISLERSDDGGQTWNFKTNGIGNNDFSNFYIPYILDPTNPSRVLLGTDHLYESLDRADDFTAIGTPNTNGFNPNGDPIDAIAVAASAPKTIYVAAAGRIFVTTDDGANWVERDIPGARDHVGGLLVDPNASQTAYAVRDEYNNGSDSGHVFRTTDGGVTWQDITGNLPDVPTNAIALDSRPGFNILYIGNDNGVYASADLGNTWTRYKTGLPDARVTSLELNTNLNILAAGTHGRGLWEIQPTGPFDITITPPAATEGVSLNNAVVATFTDRFSPEAPNFYSATIDWGDGTITTGIISSNGNTFSVAGSHTYVEGGSYTLAVTINKAGGASGSASGPIAVTDAPLQVGAAVTVPALAEGQTFSGVLANFSDTDPNPTNTADYTATIDFGDGTTAAGQVVAAPGGGFQVTGSHQYPAGDYTTKVTIKDLGGATLTVSTAVHVNDAKLDITPLPVSSVEGVALASPLGRFVDEDLRPLGASYYSATIDWGDGTTSNPDITPGVITPAPLGGFFVTGSHVYSLNPAGVPYTVHVVIKDGDVTQQSFDTTADISDAPITTQSATLPALEGVAFSGVVATFFDSNLASRAATFSARVDWGDGTADQPDVTPARVSYEGAGEFVVIGSHAYGTAGTHDFNVIITEVALKKDILTIPGQAVVAPAPISARPGAGFAGVEGVAVSGTVATFTSANPLAQASRFSATITWGDGTTSFGTVQADPNGGFDVVGTHAYGTLGLYAISVLIQSEGQETSVGTKATVADAPLSAQGTTVSAVEKQAFQGVVATFTDANPNGTPGEESATIAWGDGTTTPGVTGTGPGGKFTVTGSHTYLVGGSYSITVTLVGPTGNLTKAIGQAVVQDLEFPIVGALNPASDGGASAFDGVTDVNAPNFVGTSEPLATVQLFAVRADLGVPVPVGSAIADASGHWSVTTLPLPDGTYSVFAAATKPTGRPSSPLTMLPAPLVIDTAGPKASNVSLDPRRGQLHVTFSDLGGALNPFALANPANYSLTSTRGGAPLPVTGMAFAPGGSPGALTLTITFGGGRALRNGSYVLTMSAAGLTDLAGNKLDERFFIPFPSLFSQPGNNYIAQFNVTGPAPAGPNQFVPPNEVRAATQFGNFVRGRRKLR